MISHCALTLLLLSSRILSAEANPTALLEENAGEASWSTAKDTVAAWTVTFEVMAEELSAATPTSPLGVQADVFRRIASRLMELGTANTNEIACVDAFRRSLVQLGQGVEILPVAVLGPSSLQRDALRVFAAEAKEDFVKIYEAAGYAPADAAARLAAIIKPSCDIADDLAVSGGAAGDTERFASTECEAQWRVLFANLRSCLSKSDCCEPAVGKAGACGGLSERAGEPGSEAEGVSTVGGAQLVSQPRDSVGVGPARSGVRAAQGDAESVAKDILFAAAGAMTADNELLVSSPWCSPKWQLRAAVLCAVTEDCLRHITSADAECSCSPCQHQRKARSLVSPGG